ncbi:MAG: hypothetical protein RLZZ476_282, partial [Verrucomicrobiota bacterium]
PIFTTMHEGCTIIHGEAAFEFVTRMTLRTVLAQKRHDLMRKIHRG